jgi:benzodiazapine receptor
MEIASRSQLRAAYLRWAVVTVPLVLLLGFLSARIVPTGTHSLWYAALQKPALNPPDSVFPIVWTVLYILMGLAIAMILHARGARGKGLAITLFVVQLVVNLIWTPLFFGKHEVSLALGVIVVLCLLVLATVLVFAQVRRGAALLMVPYLLWICFAAYLNFSINQLNPNAETLVPGGAQTQIAL